MLWHYIGKVILLLGFLYIFICSLSFLGDAFKLLGGKFKPSAATTTTTSSDLRTGGRWFDPLLGQYSLRGLMIVISTELIRPSPPSVVSTISGSSQWLGKNIVPSHWLKELQQNMGWCTGRRDITEILLKTALNTIQSISYFFRFFLTLSQNKPWFLRVCSISLLKTLWEKEELLVTSNSSFSHSVFYSIVEL